ncbi:MoaD/ThiS family protein [Methanobacterium sp. VT]|uniref:MoaD/ThiS family protein n=1 Tax=Methanobacterium spitsbergense TaxID=2874285 RepID=A0A8T5V102_9EURY|nr:MoaD/ThiS family protein [Methanobacterium spitsbergense]
MQLIEIKFLTRFIDITGEKNIKIEDVPDIKTLVEFLCKKYDESFKEVLFDENGNLRDYLKVMINGEDIRDINGLDTPLKDGDQIVMFQTIAGG